MRTLKDVAAKWHVEFQPNPNGPLGGIVQFCNGILLDSGGTGSFYCRIYFIEIPLPEILTLPEIKAISELQFKLTLVAKVGKLHASITLNNPDDEILLTAIRKMLSYSRPQEAIVPTALALKPKFPPMKRFEKAGEYARRVGKTSTEVFEALNRHEIVVEGA